MRIENGVLDFPKTPTQMPGQKRMESQEQVKPDNSNIKNQRIQHMQAEHAQVQNQKADEHEVIQAIERANKHIKSYDRRLEFSIHEATKQILVKVINTENDTVIREIPSEKILDMVAHLWEVAGILVDEKR